MLKKSLGLVIFLVTLALSSNAFCEDLKIGFVNMRKVFYEYNKTKESNKRLEAEDQKIKEEVDKRAQEIRKLRDEIDLLSEKAKEKREPELRQKLKELEEFRKDKIESFIREKDGMFKQIRGDILDVASEYAKKNDYDVVFDKAIFVYSSDKYDITDQLIEELNK